MSSVKKSKQEVKLSPSDIQETPVALDRDTRFRNLKKLVPQEVQDLAEQSKQYFRNQLGEFVYFRTYSRWMDELGRRETWIETVDRYIGFMKENLGDKLTQEEYSEVRAAILKQEAMPSMRLLQFAGKAARTNNIAAYNCSFIAPTKLQDFGEIMFISMSGTGVGFSAESRYVEQLPEIKKQTGEMVETFVIPDSREGWADALVNGLKAWFEGKDIQFDYSLIRPAGARLKTFGGQASGPAPLMDLLTYAREKVLGKQGRKLETIDVHDLICKIGDIVVAGGVRRSALISLSDLNDSKIRDAKTGEFWNTHPERSLSNNSAVYENKPEVEIFLDEWLSLIRSKSGERGIFNRGSLKATLPARRMDYLKGNTGDLGTNPCGEIILQSKQFCNLSEIVAREEDTEESLMRKMRIATILGTYQSTLTKFPYLSKEWKKHCEEERLLGVSITGQWDCKAARKPEMLAKLKELVLKTNKEYAERFGITPSTCTTCVKPSGNLSQTVDCSSGLHPRYAQYYIRRVRIGNTDPLFALLKDQGVPFFPEVGQTAEKATTWVVEFPIKSPKGSLYKDDITALEQLEYWKLLKETYTEHNPSATIYVGSDEWVKVGNWVYENWSIVGGLSFLPKNDDHIYQLAPYEAIDKKRYQELVKKIGNIDYSLLYIYEKEDMTEAKRELACAGGSCEI